MATTVRTIFDQPDAAAVRDQFGRVVEAVEAKYPDAATHLDDARDDLLAFAGGAAILGELLDRISQPKAQGPARVAAAGLEIPILTTACRHGPSRRQNAAHGPRPG